jgi:flagellin
MLSVQTNVSAISAQRHLGATSNALGTAMERLSSGFRINRAADDAAGLAVSEKLKAQIGGLNQASRNAQDGISMIQTAEGALDEVQSMMQRMRDLGVQAASDTNSQTERDNINLELGQLGKEINSISMRTKFNGQSLLSGSLTKAQYLDTNGAATAFESANTALTNDTSAATGYALTDFVVSNVNVEGAQAGRSFHLSATASEAGHTALDRVTLTMFSGATTGATAETMKSQSGQTSTVEETITLSDLAANGSMTLNFASLGVKITVTETTGAAVTADTAALDFASSGNLVVDTATASGLATLQTGANQGDETAVAFVNTALAGGTGVEAMDTLAATLKQFASEGGASRENASSLITALDNALGSISSSRATLGAAQNRLQHTIANLSTTAENLSASNSRIRDVDVATESSNMAKNQVLEQAGVSVLAQANQLPQLALKLLS